MPESTQNNQANVSTGGGVKGGYCYSAPEGTPLPTDFETPLNEAFLVMGFISEDGYVEGLDEDSSDIVDMNGDLMCSASSSRVESATVTFAEIKAETLKRQYGAKNVTDANGMITVKHNGDSHSTFAYVLELVLRDGRHWRKVVPHGQSAELDELTIAKSELCQRQLTIKYLTDEDGNTCYDYIESTETEVPQTPTPTTGNATITAVSGNKSATLSITNKADYQEASEVTVKVYDQGTKNTASDVTGKYSGGTITFTFEPMLSKETKYDVTLIADSMKESEALTVTVKTYGVN